MSNPYLPPVQPVELAIPATPSLDGQRLLAVLAFDSGWMAQGLACIATLRRRAPAALHIAVLGMGLSAKERKALQDAGVEHQEMPRTIPLPAGAPAHARALACRPMLPELFPGHDVYFWVDSDIRFLRDDAVEFYLRCAGMETRPVVIAAELDAAYNIYRTPTSHRIWAADRRARVGKMFGADAADAVDGFLQYNAGLWCMHRESPVWDHYREHVERGARVEYDRLWEQDSMNLAILASGMKVWTAPTTHNWICSMSIPLFRRDTGEWLRPLYPYVPLAVAHLTDQRSLIEVAGHGHMTLGAFYEKSGLLKAA